VKKEVKTAIIKDITASLAENPSFFLIDFKKMKVGQSVELRKLLRRNNYRYKVVKNRLALKALADRLPAEVKASFQGPTAIAMAAQDPVGLAKVIKEYGSQSKALAVKAGVIEGVFFPAERFEEICRLASREEMLGRIAFLMSYQLGRFLRTLQSPLANFGLLLGQLRDKKKE
jgi:large subunit ribosomal protein L10